MSNPRIIAGKARGVRLHAVPGNVTRPITDRVKEALFNIIGADIHGAAFFDLFGGTGSVGIEALSRGASFARFLEKDAGAYKTIKNNLLLTHLDAGAQVILTDTFSYIKQPADRVFDYIFIAPPQYKDLWKRTLKELQNNLGWLSPDGWVIIQIDPNEDEEVEWSPLAVLDRRRYGSTLLIFLENAAAG